VNIPVIGFNAVLMSEHFASFFVFAVLHAVLAIQVRWGWEVAGVGYGVCVGWDASFGAICTEQTVMIKTACVLNY
jgi:hypothetical protein